MNKTEISDIITTILNDAILQLQFFNGGMRGDKRQSWFGADCVSQPILNNTVQQLQQIIQQLELNKNEIEN